MWWHYALLSALFAALTAVLAKVGIAGVDSTLATAVRTAVVLILAWTIVFFRGGLTQLHTLTRTQLVFLVWTIVFFRGGLTQLHTLTRTQLVFLVLSGLATGGSWLFYFRALQSGTVTQVAAVDKLSVALAIVLSVVFLGEKLSWQTALGAGLIITGTLVLLWK